MAAEKVPSPPPHLRVATNEGEECDQCVYFDHQHCTKHPPACVDGEWVCDDFKDSGRPDPDASGDQALKGAGRTARGMLRERREQQQ